eukprot:scaffold328123_cov58-Tisochrysis_lutea.AAC.1
MDANEANASPKTCSPTQRRPESLPTTATSAAQSFPGGPGSPGYAPKTFRTSRKLRPTERICNSTSIENGSRSKPCCGPTSRLLKAPRASKWRQIGPLIDRGASATRGTHHDSFRSTASGSGH